MDIGHPVIHQAPKRLIGLRPARAPPEPAAARLVQWPPQDGHACLLQLLQFCADEVNIMQKALIFRAAWVFKRLFEVEIRFFRIEMPLTFCLGGRHPMPTEGDDPPALCHSIACWME